LVFTVFWCDFVAPKHLAIILCSRRQADELFLCFGWPSAVRPAIKIKYAYAISDNNR
jgi:hypothetical protein